MRIFARKVRKEATAAEIKTEMATHWGLALMQQMPFNGKDREENKGT